MSLAVSHHCYTRLKWRYSQVGRVSSIRNLFLSNSIFEFTERNLGEQVTSPKPQSMVDINATFDHSTHLERGTALNPRFPLLKPTPFLGPSLSLALSIPTSRSHPPPLTQRRSSLSIVGAAERVCQSLGRRRIAGDVRETRGSDTGDNLGRSKNL